MTLQSWFSVGGLGADPWQRRLERRWLRQARQRPADVLRLPGCTRHLRVLDNQGRCPVCHNLGVKPSWW